MAIMTPLPVVSMIDELVNKISAASNTDKDEVMRLVEEKQIELSGLVSEEGAAYLVAKDLGVHLKREAEKLNIENIIPGMQNVDVTGKVTRIFPVREFKTEKAEGRVANVVISDLTGSIKMSLWNDEIEKLQGMEVGDVVNVRGFVKEGLGQPEIRLGKRGFIVKSEDTQGYENVRHENRADRSTISEMRENMYRSVRAAILQIFESNVFYEICPQCRKRLKEEQDGFVCAEHGMIENIDFGIILSGIIDDGSGNIRGVFFGEAAEKLIGMSVKDAKKLFDRKKKTEAVTSLVPLGKEFIFEGRVRRNNFFDRLEFVVNSVKSVDIKKEIGMLLNANGADKNG